MYMHKFDNISCMYSYTYIFISIYSAKFAQEFIIGIYVHYPILQIYTYIYLSIYIYNNWVYGQIFEQVLNGKCKRIDWKKAAYTFSSLAYIEANFKCITLYHMASVQFCIEFPFLHKTRTYN